ncbi:MAG TPA: alpha/beta hydrolase [Gemmatimonadaceae bacterium]
MDGYPLMIREEGRGRPLLFLHALGASSRYWYGRLGSVPNDYHCVMPDLLGFGRSPKPDVGYAVRDHLAAFRLTLDRLHLTDRPIVLIGHSLGAVLALEYAAMFPAEVCGVIGFGLPYYANKAEAERYISDHGQWMARVTVRNGRVAHLTHMVLASLRPLIAPVAARTTRGYPPEVAADSMRHTWASYSRTLDQCILSHNLMPTMDALTALPILALHGTHDPSAPLAGVQTLASRMTNFQLQTLEGGHHLFFEQHATCLTAIQRYLRTVE